MMVFVEIVKAVFIFFLFIEDTVEVELSADTILVEQHRTDIFITEDILHRKEVENTSKKMLVRHFALFSDFVDIFPLMQLLIWPVTLVALARRRIV
jgi:hypothetical protein